MKKLIHKLSGLMMILVIFFTAFNGSFAQKSKGINGNTKLELNGYSVVSPSGDDWKFITTPNNNVVQFFYESSSFVSGKENMTYILVFKDSLIKEITKSEREYASEFLEENLKGFIAKEEHMKIMFRRNYDTSIAGRNYFAMSSKADDHDFAIPCTYADNLFFIYFPDDLKFSRTFYQFLIISFYNLPPGKKNSNESDLKPIYSMLKSFKIDEAVVPDKIRE